jgi:hypothetical protein
MTNTNVTSIAPAAPISPLTTALSGLFSGKTFGNKAPVEIRPAPATSGVLPISFEEHGDLFLNGSGRSTPPVHPVLPAGTYVIGCDMKMGFFLTRTADLQLPKKVYGDTSAQAYRILMTFLDRPRTTGVHLDGTKGSGKTVLASQVSWAARQMGIPTLLLSSAFTGEGFYKFLQSITQPAVIILDEAEKTYKNEGDQNALLTLLDGVYPLAKKLFLLTTNEGDNLVGPLRDRPNRIFYYWEFDVLAMDVVREMAQDKLTNQGHLQEFLFVANTMGGLRTFDCIVSLIEECNRYDLRPTKAIEGMNIAYRENNRGTYAVEVAIKATGEVVPVAGTIGISTLMGNHFLVDIKPAVSHPDGSRTAAVSCYVSTLEDLVSVSDGMGEFVFETDDFKLHLSLKKVENYNTQILDYFSDVASGVVDPTDKSVLTKYATDFDSVSAKAKERKATLRRRLELDAISKEEAAAHSAAQEKIVADGGKPAGKTENEYLPLPPIGGTFGINSSAVPYALRDLGEEVVQSAARASAQRIFDTLRVATISDLPIGLARAGLSPETSNLIFGGPQPSKAEGDVVVNLAEQDLAERGCTVATVATHW